MKSHLQSVRLALGGVLMKEGKLFEAMEMFEQVKTPPGMYNLAQVLFPSLGDSNTVVDSLIRFITKGQNY